MLAIAGALVAVAIVRLPGEGGHVPAEGLKTGVTQPIELPGVLLAAVAGIGLGVVLGPEAPLIALGGGLGVLVLRRVRKDAPEELTAVMAAAGTFAALAMIFESPLIASVVVIEAAGLGGPRLPVVLVPACSPPASGRSCWSAWGHGRVSTRRTSRSESSTCRTSPAPTWPMSGGASSWPPRRRWWCSSYFGSPGSSPRFMVRPSCSCRSRRSLSRAWRSPSPRRRTRGSTRCSSRATAVGPSCRTRARGH